MAKLKELLVIAPYWCDPQHLGRYRVERFIRWLSGRGVSLIVVAAADTESCRDMAWGKLITLRDPLGIYGERDNQRVSVPLESPSVQGNAVKKRPGWLRLLAYLLLSPDPGLLWARRAARHPLVLEYASKADAVLSSSFPESAHIAASSLAVRFELPLFVDMRDGWLDEPMKPLLASSALQRWREGWQEKHILRQARLITVTSEQWRRMLIARLPFTRDKTVVVTNAYPRQCDRLPAMQKLPQRHLNLLYAGRIFTSRAERRIEHLLQPLLHGLQASRSEGVLTFVGELAQVELDGLEVWRPQFLQIGWKIQTRSLVPRQIVLELMHEADGLVLLSSSQASIPAKLFDYLCALRPILAVAPADSAVADLEAQLPQLFVTDYRVIDEVVAVSARFLEACRNCAEYELPIQFSDAHTGHLFLNALDSAIESTV